jgi:hypothetical protein
MDPFSALSLAACVVQFIDFSGRLLSKGHEIYQSEVGSSAETVELEVIYKDLSRLSDKLKASSLSISPTSGRSLEEKALGKLAASCKGVADELLATLKELKVADGPHRKWRSVRKAFKSVWKKEKIEALQQRIDNLRDQLSIQLIAGVK